MNDPILWRLVWKEYRTQRAFWLAVAALGVLCQFAVAAMGRLGWLMFEGRTDGWAGAAIGAALVFAALYALGCAATLLSAERDEGTFERLRALAVPPGRLVAAKVGFAMVSTACITVVLWAAAWTLSPRPLPGLTLALDGVWSMFGVAILEALAWGLLFSAVVKRPLHAAGLAGAAVTGMALLQLASDRPVFTYEAQWYQWMATVPLRLSVATGVLVLATAAAWWHAKGFPLVDLVARPLAMLPRRGRTRRDASARAPTSRRHRGPLGSLIWHERRQAVRTVLLFAVATTAVVLLTGAGVTPFGLRTVGSVVVGSLIASCTFLAEQEGRRFRFLAHQGVSPRLVWLSKHVVWMPVVALTPVLMTLLAWTPALVGVPWTRGPLTALRVDLPRMATLVGAVLLCAYAPGQFASMLIPRGLIAAFVGLMLTGALVGWEQTMEWLGVSPWWSVAPLGVILVSATWARAPDWMLERRGWRPALRLAAVVGLPVAALFVAVATYRVYQIPGGSPGFSVTAYLVPVSVEQRDTADLYRQAMKRLDPFPLSKEQRTASIAPTTSWDDVSPEQRRWLQAHTAVLETTVEASRRSECAFRDPGQPEMSTYSDDAAGMWSLAQLVLLDGLRSGSEGRLDEALDRYLAVLRMANHYAERGDFDQHAIADSIEGDALDRLVAWAGHKEQTAQRITRALVQLDAVTRARSDPADALKTEYARLRQEIRTGFAGLADDPRSPRQVAADSLLGRFMPWERTRSLRLLDALCAERLRELARVEAALQRGGDATVALSHRDDRFDQWTQTTRYARDLLRSFMWSQTGRVVFAETRRRAVRILLALKAWQIEHGRLPASLDELAGTYLDRLPMDPYSGRSFHYQPTGFPTAVQFASPREPVPANRPLLWSVWPGNAVLTQTGVTADALPLYAFAVPGREGWCFFIP